VNKTKIDWADSTWNPVTGCLHGCEYCYARRIAYRFRDKDYDKNKRFYAPECTFDLAIKPRSKYPYAFRPTLHRYRLNDYKAKKGRTIFVCSMADMLGGWVPDEWIQAVLKACYAAHQLRYLFLTKNPERYANIVEYLEGEDGPEYDAEPPEIWLGATVTNNEQMYTAYQSAATWISIEPLIESISSADECTVTFRPYDSAEEPRWLWAVIGAETGSRKGKVVPERAWVQEIAEQCKTAGVPVFMKESLRELMGDEFVQEFPWEEKKIILAPRKPIVEGEVPEY